MEKRVKNTAKVLFKILLAIGLLYCFLVSIGLMGTAFKGFGKGFAENLIRTTSNPFIGLFIGILATSIVQSSSTTTSLVVGMVGSGVIEVSCAIPIIMGANIGTTVTNTLVSLGHVSRRDEFRRAISAATVNDFFNLICVVILFPLELATGFLEKSATLMSASFEGIGGIKFTSPIKLATKPAVYLIHEAANFLTSST
jgi:sodium-dependent phosphate cotransporter